MHSIASHITVVQYQEDKDKRTAGDSRRSQMRRVKALISLAMLHGHTVRKLVLIRTLYIYICIYKTEEK